MKTLISGIEKEYKEIGVIATEGTIRSGEWERQLRKNISNINVINKACPMLATIAEEGRATGIEGRNAIKEYMKSFKEKKIISWLEQDFAVSVFANHSMMINKIKVSNLFEFKDIIKN